MSKACQSHSHDAGVSKRVWKRRLPRTTNARVGRKKAFLFCTLLAYPERFPRIPRTAGAPSGWRPRPASGSRPPTRGTPAPTPAKRAPAPPARPPPPRRARPAAAAAPPPPARQGSRPGPQVAGLGPEPGSRGEVEVLLRRVHDPGVRGCARRLRARDPAPPARAGPPRPRRSSSSTPRSGVRGEPPACACPFSPFPPPSSPPRAPDLIPGPGSTMRTARRTGFIYGRPAPQAGVHWPRSRRNPRPQPKSPLGALRPGIALRPG